MNAYVAIAAIVAGIAALLGIPASIYAVVVARSSKKGSDINQLAIDLAGSPLFCDKMVLAVVYDDKFRDRSREIFTDRVQMMINERHIVGGGEDREFKDGLRRELDDLRKSMDALARDVRLVLRRSDGDTPRP